MIFGRPCGQNALRLLSQATHGQAKHALAISGLLHLVQSILFAAVVVCPSGVQAHMAADCNKAGQAAEIRYALPRGLLRAIGRVETGGYRATSHESEAWPWSVDVDGTAHRFDTAEDAVRWTSAISTGNHHSIDVGCFQISLLYHPNAFASMDEAFDPSMNADYAARFLVSLKERLGSWAAAVAAYHSMEPERGTAYRQRVFAAWSGHESLHDEIITPDTFISGVHVWRPTAGASGLTVIVLDPQPPALPRVVTPIR